MRRASGQGDADRAKAASDGVTFFWAMIGIAAKYVLEELQGALVAVAHAQQQLTDQQTAFVSIDLAQEEEKRRAILASTRASGIET